MIIVAYIIIIAYEGNLFGQFVNYNYSVYFPWMHDKFICGFCPSYIKFPCTFCISGKKGFSFKR